MITLTAQLQTTTALTVQAALHILQCLVRRTGYGTDHHGVT